MKPRILHPLHPYLLTRLNLTPPPPILPHVHHHMITRAKHGIVKPIQRPNLHTTSISPTHRSHLQAIQDPNWRKAMNDERNALMTNDAWQLVSRP